MTVTPSADIPVFTLGATSIRCQGGGLVTYTAAATNSTGITYTLDAGSIAGGNSIDAVTGEVTFIALWSGTTTITASAAGCNGPATANHDVTVNPLPVVTITDPPSSCSSGTADLTLPAVTAGSTAGLTFTYWTDAVASVALLTPAAAPLGVYYIKGTDGSGCYDIKSVTVAVNVAPTVTSTQTDVLCFGAFSGAIDITAAGGIGPYTYSWTGAGVSVIAEDQTGLAAGSYSVIVTDAVLCSVTGNITITEPASALTGNITSQTNVLITGGNDGAVTVAGAGGTAPYLFKLGSGVYQVSGTFGTLSAGSYIVTVQDASLCTIDVPVTITQPSALLSGSIKSQTDVLCFGGNTGSVTVEGSGGTTPYEYKIAGGSYQSSGTFGTLTAGIYTVVVRDAALTTFDVVVTIAQPAVALGGFITSQTNVLCFGTSSGTVSVDGTGGISPYHYKLGTSSYQVSGTFGTLAAGVYAVTVQDANLCTFDVSVTISQPALAFTGSVLAHTNASCFGSSNGSVTIAAMGGTAPYEFSLNGGAYQSSGVFNGLAAATYTITVRDANSCTINVPATVTEPAVLSITSEKEDSSCPGATDGSIVLTIAGGTSPYSANWEDGIPTADRSNIAAGTYSVVVTDSKGCTASLDVIISIVGSGNCLEIQQIITPNDDGFNDTWKIKNIDLFPNAEVFVFSRWGKLVFNTKNISANEWDGTFKGKILPTDSYHYMLHLNDGSEPLSGVISIIR
jgi:gliding motility-associated-like protein